MRPPSDCLGLAVVLVVTVAVRAYAWSNTAVLFNDGPVFLALAEAIGEGRWAEVLAHPYHPLYPALIALVAAFSVDLESAAVAVSIAGGVISVAAMFWFVRDAFDREVAWLAAWMLALHPWAVDFSSDVMSDGIYSGIFLVGFALMVKLVERPLLRNSVACGVVCGIAYLVRPEGAGLFVVGAILLVYRIAREREGRGRALAACLTLMLAGLFVIGPFALAVSRVTGDFSVTQKKSISRMLADPASPAVRAQKQQERKRLKKLARALPLPELAIRADGPGATRPDRSWRGGLEAVGRVGTTAMSAFRWELLILALVGFLSTRSDRRPSRDRAVGLIFISYMGLLVLLVWGEGYVSRRHALPPWLPLIGYAALGARVLWRAGVVRLAAGNVGLTSRLQAPRALYLAVILALVLGWGARDVRPRRLDREPVRAAAQWLAENRAKSGSVAAQKLRVAYYAKADFVPLMTGHDGRLEDYLRRRGARWVVIDRAKLVDHRGLVGGMGQWLRLIHTSLGQGVEVFVLSVEPKPAS